VCNALLESFIMMHQDRPELPWLGQALEGHIRRGSEIFAPKDPTLPRCVDELSLVSLPIALTYVY